jgi:hypothetical protein
VLCFGENFLVCWEGLFCDSWVQYFIDCLSSCDLWYHLILMFLCWVCYSEYLSIKVTHYYCSGVYLWFYVQWSIFHEMGRVNVWSIYVYMCYIILMDCSLYHNKVTFFVSSDQFCFEVRYGYNNSCLLLDSLFLK